MEALACREGLGALVWQMNFFTKYTYSAWFDLNGRQIGMFGSLICLRVFVTLFRQFRNVSDSLKNLSMLRWPLLHCYFPAVDGEIPST
jgi:hypothetical protein